MVCPPLLALRLLQRGLWILSSIRQLTLKVRKGGWERLEQAKIEERVTSHGLRHTYASMLILLNRKIPEISRYLGHADVSITRRVYAHFLKTQKQDTMSDLERLIENG